MTHYLRWASVSLFPHGLKDPVGCFESEDEEVKQILAQNHDVCKADGPIVQNRIQVILARSRAPKQPILSI